jgi:hypothetical protein
MAEQRRALMDGAVAGGWVGGGLGVGVLGGDPRQAELCTNSCVDAYSNILRSSRDNMVVQLREESFMKDESFIT